MHPDTMTLAYARQALRLASRDYLFDPNVHFIDFGYPEHHGQIAEDELSIRIHVLEKLSDYALEDAVQAGATRPIPPTIGGFPTDVPVGKYRPHSWGNWSRRTTTEPRAARSTPLRGGISISDERHNTYGTLGGLAFDRATGDPMILSNWHVLAGDWTARSGQRIYQAGQLDGGTRTDTVAALTRHAMGSNLDAAVAALNGSRPLVNDQLDLGPVRGVVGPELGMQVVKSGRRTGVTYGRVTAVEGIARMRYASLDRIIRDVVTIEPRWNFDTVSGPGDSGSLWLENGSMKAIGLHFAGSDRPERALALDISSVIQALDIELATSVSQARFISIPASPAFAHA